MIRTTKTSENNPLLIAEIDAGEGGRIGITFAPGKFQPSALSGSHARDLDADLDVIAAWNAAVVITLVEAHELEALRIARIGVEVRRRHMDWHHWPIGDYQTPNATFEAAWPSRSAMLRTLLACGGRVLIHCKGGLGRAGTIAARLLVESGEDASAAIARVRAARPGAIETRAQEQWVALGRSEPLATPSREYDGSRDRALGALLGLAVGDALGAAIEFEQKPRFAMLDDMVAGGPHRLERGQWTDDTAMALALADSLITAPDLDPRDLMDRFVAWWREGTYSCTGTCFDIGNATREALIRYQRTSEPLAGSTDPSRSGNGALMRLAPVAIRHWRDRALMLRVADVQTRTTHGSPATLDASRRFAGMLADAIAGVSLPEVLASPAAVSIEGGWRGLHRDRAEGSGYVARSLQAAVWAVSRTTSFRAAVLLAANLGDDADTTAAVAGQLAGAIYGLSGIPKDWIDTLAWRARIQETADRLFDAGWPIAPAESDVGTELDKRTLGGPFAAWCMTADWTLQQRLGALAAFHPLFDRDDFVFAEHTEAVRNGTAITMGFHSLTNEAQRFYDVVYNYGWVRNFNWSDWRETERGTRLMHDANMMDEATEDDLACLITVCIRADRFCDGYLASAYEAGLIGRIVARADELLGLLEQRFCAENREA